MNNLDAYKKHVAAGEGGLFLKFEDGKSIRLRLAGECYIFNSTYTNPITHESNTSTRYAWAAWNIDEERAQVVQLPATGFKMVQALAIDPEWGDPADYDIKITRTGSGKDTKYSLTPSPTKTALPKEAVEAVGAVDMPKAVKGIPLAQVVDGAEIPPADATEAQDASHDPFDDLPPASSYGSDEKVNISEIPF